MQSKSIEDERSRTSQGDGYSSDKDINSEPEEDVDNVYHSEELSQVDTKELEGKGASEQKQMCPLRDSTGIMLYPKPCFCGQAERCQVRDCSELCPLLWIIGIKDSEEHQPFLVLHIALYILHLDIIASTLSPHKHDERVLSCIQCNWIDRRCIGQEVSFALREHRTEGAPCALVHEVGAHDDTGVRGIWRCDLLVWIWNSAEVFSQKHLHVERLLVCVKQCLSLLLCMGVCGGRGSVWCHHPPSAGSPGREREREVVLQLHAHV